MNKIDKYYFDDKRLNVYIKTKKHMQPFERVAEYRDCKILPFMSDFTKLQKIEKYLTRMSQ